MRTLIPDVADGRMLFREIRGQGIESPVLMVSAYGSRRAQQELGAEDYLEKPFDIDELTDRVARLAARTRADGGPV